MDKLNYGNLTTGDAIQFEHAPDKVKYYSNKITDRNSTNAKLAGVAQSNS